MGLGYMPKPLIGVNIFRVKFDDSGFIRHEFKNVQQSRIEPDSKLDNK
jgi:hypothetical protein